jgi:hypothetical protein
MKFTPKFIAVLAVLCGSSAFAAGGGYLFATFKGGATAASEQIYFAVSADGRAWTALNRSAPVLTSEVGEKGVRDPYLIRTHGRNTASAACVDALMADNEPFGAVD